MNRTAEIIIVGDEILAGEVPDQNGPRLLATLARLGTHAAGLRILPDSRPELAAAIRGARSGNDLVLVSGGIGPTHDDLTRPALAEALDRPLVAHPDALARLRRLLGDRATPEEEAMARLPQGAVLFTAPECKMFGFRVENVLVFPGVPILLDQLLAANTELLTGQPRLRREVQTHLREGVLAKELARLAAAWPEVHWGSYPDLENGRWRLRLVIHAADAEMLAWAESALRGMLESHDNRG
jgi:molybdenum cofactor synthesis domain-containing protein